MTHYLQNLTIRLASGVEQLPESQRRRHRDWLLSQQQADGGFAGREGPSDIYYTSFGLRSLAILGELYGPTADRVGSFLQTRLGGREGVVDFLSLIYSATLLEAAAGIDIFEQAASSWREATAAKLEELRRDDGGYAKGSEGNASSTYHSFLVLLCLQMLEQPIPDPQRLLAFLLSQRTDEGGFREIRASKRAGTNPTAAAIGGLRILEQLHEPLVSDAVEFLAEMQTDEGGLRANTRIPIADLLSSFTGLWTLETLRGTGAIDLPALGRFAHSLEESGGGFRGAEWDQACDVEYTFYGLGTLALLAGLDSPAENATE
jgi:geranylgeranyl transferase type-2 subunit beta